MNQNKLIVSNWKMNLKLSDSRILVKKIIEHTPVETGFPGNPRKGIFSNNPKNKGFPGLIAIRQNRSSKLFFSSAL